MCCCMQITDRSKDVIKSGGEWISSLEIENVAVGHPQVAGEAPNKQCRGGRRRLYACHANWQRCYAPLPSLNSRPLRLSFLTACQAALAATAPHLLNLLRCRGRGHRNPRRQVGRAPAAGGSAQGGAGAPNTNRGCAALHTVLSTHTMPCLLLGALDLCLVVPSICRSPAVRTSWASWRARLQSGGCPTMWCS